MQHGTQAFYTIYLAYKRRERMARAARLVTKWVNGALAVSAVMAVLLISHLVLSECGVLGDTRTANAVVSGNDYPGTKNTR